MVIGNSFPQQSYGATSASSSTDLKSEQNSKQPQNDSLKSQATSKNDRVESSKQKESFQSYLDRPDVKLMLMKLQSTDAKVRTHEAAHIAAGAGVVSGGASFTYQTGPDGRQYAVGGEVPVDFSTGSTPEQTASKMRQVRAAALAPSDPSPQDLKVASTAAMLEARANIEAQQAKIDSRDKKTQTSSKTAINSSS